MINPDYIVGLVDGEGSFTVHVRKPTTKRRARVEPRFLLKLNESDKQMIYDLQSFFNCGSVYFQKDKRPNHKDCYRFEVYNRNHLSDVIIPFFKKHRLCLISKKKDFDLFCKIMEMIRDDVHLSDSGLEKIFSLKKHMH